VAAPVIAAIFPFSRMNPPRWSPHLFLIGGAPAKRIAARSPIHLYQMYSLSMQSDKARNLELI